MLEYGGGQDLELADLIVFEITIKRLEQYEDDTGKLWDLLTRLKSKWNERRPFRG